MNPLVADLEQYLIQHQLQTRPLWIAFSGGRDSHVLLHALWQLRPAINLRAIHVHHGVQPAADHWVTHTQQICQSLEIPWQCQHLHLQVPSGESVENLARVARYDAFAQLLQDQDVLMTAHTQDDQAETFLLQLCRGSGPKGLAGIAPIKPLGQGLLMRPLLGVDRQSIAEYADHYQLNFIEDATNADRRFRRNFMRHEVMPVIQQAYPGVVGCLARSSEHCANSEQLLQEYLQADYRALINEQEKSLQIEPLRMLSPLKQQAVFRYWLARNGVKSPFAVKLKEILRQMLAAKVDARPCVKWEGVEVRRFKGRIFLIKRAPSLRGIREWNLQDILHLPNGSQWQARLVKGRGIAQSKIPEGLQVTSRQGGEKCRLPGRNGTRALKKVLQEMEIAEWERGELPLFYSQNVLVGVADLFICDGWQEVDPEKEGWVVERIS